MCGGECKEVAGTTSTSAHSLSAAYSKYFSPIGATRWQESCSSYTEPEKDNNLGAGYHSGKDVNTGRGSCGRTEVI